MKLAAVTAKTLRCHASGRGATALAPAVVLMRTGLESDLHVGILRDVNAVDEPDAVRLVLHDHRTGARAVAEEADAAHQRAVGDAGRREDDAFAGREIPRSVDPLEILDAHRAAALFVLRLVDDEPREDFTVQAAHRRGRQHAFRRAAGAHHRVDSRADHSRRDAGRKIAVADQTDAGAGGANVVDQLLVPRS